MSVPPALRGQQQPNRDELSPWPLAVYFLTTALFGFTALPTPAQTAPPSLPTSLTPYELSPVNNPYLRTPDYYGLDKYEPEESLLEGLLEEFTLPLLINFRIEPFYNSNVLYNNQTHLGSFGTFINPSFLIPMGNDKFSAVLDYGFRASIYQAVPQNNYVDNFLGASTVLEFDHRNRLAITARGAFAHDPLGTMFSQGNVVKFLQRPNEWTGYSFSTLYQYGAAKAQGNLNFRFSVDDRRYTNNLLLTKQRDLTTYNLGATFFYRVMPKTNLVFEVNDTILDYPYPQNNGGSLNGSVYRAFTGATWVPTVKTRVVAKVGYQWRQFTDENYQSKGSPAFQGMVAWQPRPQDGLMLSMSNAFNEALIFGSNSVNTQNYAFNWNHVWLERFTTNAGVFYMNQQFSGNDTQNQTINGMLGANYAFRPGINTGLEYRYSTRFSNRQQYSFDQNLVLMWLQVAF